MYQNASPIQFALVVGAVFLSWLILANARFIGEKLNIIDHPDGLRKVHEKATPLVAGFGILIPFFVWIAATLATSAAWDPRALLVALLCGLGATLIGYSDDQSSTSPSSRLLSILLFAVVALVVDPGLVPTSIRLAGWGPVPVPYWLAVPLVTIALAGLVNAVNMADGQNGVVIGMLVVWTACLAITTNGAISAMAQTLLITALTAFVFNVAGLAFLGDSGTYGLGFVVGLLAIWAHNSSGVPAQTVCVWFFFPVLDCLRLIVKRVRRRLWPFRADLDHFHHHLQARLGQNLSLVVYLGVTAVTSVSSSLDPKIAPFCLISLVAFYFTVILPAREVESEELELLGDQRVERLHLVENNPSALVEHHRRANEQR
ncbi:MAG TPA: MraY family glycosyltransferase [Rhizomicrobium sp.]